MYAITLYVLHASTLTLTSSSVTPLEDNGWPSQVHSAFISDCGTHQVFTRLVLWFIEAEVPENISKLLEGY